MTESSKPDWAHGLNPRWALWMLSRGEDPASYEPSTYDKPKYIDGMPRALVFSFWIRDRWREWAEGLGFTRGREMRTPWEEAIWRGAGTASDFDAWLVGKIRGTK